MHISDVYNFSLVEGKWYSYWSKNGYFHSIPNDKLPYTIVIPPPNVTGILHMGHMLNATIQDVLIRRARLRGFNACWVPGTDHASIATEVKVIEKLRSEGIEKRDLTREEFLKHAWDWTHKHDGIIIEQLKKIGASCDWNRTKFTMDEDMSASVISIFIHLYEKGFIYRDYRMVNWDPEAKTTLSDEEVIFEEEEGKLYYIHYRIENSDDVLTLATTRPETLFGDVAVCVNPRDERYLFLKGKKVIVPILNKAIPIIMDAYVDLEFGTGCLKVTPAHDKNDKILGEKYNLETINIFNEDATLNKNGLHYEGKDRFEVRKEIVKELENNGLLVKTELYLHKVGRSERTKSVVEPRLSLQWFLRMDTLVKPALHAVLKKKEINLYPKRYEVTYQNWLENIRDWNISRQLWWGHQIPAFFYGEGVDDFVVAISLEKAIPLAIKKSGNKNLKAVDLSQDPDVLDTWFSSWIWPISVFDGINRPKNEEFAYYYPTNDLITGPDIIFFWVSRMIFAGYEFKEERPFSNVYFTGIVRDKMRRKMSKSLGNSPDPIKLIEKYGADALRIGLLLSASAGNDLMFDESLCVQGRNFLNKIWNAFKLIKSWKVSEDLIPSEVSKMTVSWYRSKFQKTLKAVNQLFDEFKISEALMAIYKLIWDDFCSWCLEILKPPYGEPIDGSTFRDVISFLEDNMKILHPFMPHLTEEIWHLISERVIQQALMVSEYPKETAYSEEIIIEFETITEVISKIRNIRKEKKLSFKEKIDLSISNKKYHPTKFDGVLSKMVNVSRVSYGDEATETALSFRVKSNEYFVFLKQKIDLDLEKFKLNEELKYAEGFLKSVQKKLSNDRFMKNAPERIIEIERKKESDILEKIQMIKENLKFF